MNQIPSVGSDAAIAPRTGSGSPQSSPQQRADAVATVVADSISARADPGVMLKVVPPPQTREGGVAVQRDEATNNALLALLQLLRDPGRVEGESVDSATDADQAIAARLARFLANLPPDVQKAIESAKTPELAKLIRLSAMTAPGIREAPAVLAGRSDPLATDPMLGMEELLRDIESSPVFKLTAKLRDLVSTESVSTRLGESPPRFEANQTLRTEAGAYSQAANGTAQGFLNLLNEAANSAQPSYQDNSPRLAVGAEIAQNFDAGDLQQAVKDGLRLLMDGRLIWQGEIVPGSPLRFERSDAWGTSAESPGGMEKGTVLKIQLEHPELGRIELRALGLGGLVNIRLFGSEPAISMMLGALPKMNDRLKQVGLSGTQISVESH